MRQHDHVVKDGKVQVVKGRTQPRQLRGVDSWSEGTVRIGPLSRVLSALGDKIGGK